MLPLPAQARRFHTMEAYRAYRDHRHGHSDTGRRSSDIHSTHQPSTSWTEDVLAVPYQYAVGNINGVLDGSFFGHSDRFCQPLTLQYLNANARMWEGR